MSTASAKSHGRENEILWCHVSKKDLMDFYNAIGKEKNWPVTPDSFFEPRKLRKIAHCDFCTFMVISAYELALETSSPAQMLVRVRQSFRRFLIDRKNPERNGKTHWKSVEERMSALYFC